MSWSVSTHGTHNEVKNHIGADPTMPPSVKSAVDYALAAFRAEQHVEVLTSGHIDASGGNATISVSTTIVDVHPDRRDGHQTKGEAAETALRTEAAQTDADRARADAEQATIDEDRKAKDHNLRTAQVDHDAASTHDAFDTQDVKAKEAAAKK